jgi:hypothetical protein
MIDQYDQGPMYEVIQHNKQENFMTIFSMGTLMDPCQTLRPSRSHFYIVFKGLHYRCLNIEKTIHKDGK